MGEFQGWSSKKQGTQTSSLIPPRGRTNIPQILPPLCWQLCSQRSHGHRSASGCIHRGHTGTARPPVHWAEHGLMPTSTARKNQLRCREVACVREGRGIQSWTGCPKPGLATPLAPPPLKCKDFPIGSGEAAGGLPSALCCAAHMSTTWHRWHEPYHGSAAAAEGQECRDGVTMGQRDLDQSFWTLQWVELCPPEGYVQSRFTPGLLDCNLILE